MIERVFDAICFFQSPSKLIDQSICLFAHLLGMREGALDFLARVLGFLVKIDGLMWHLLHFHIESRATLIDILNLGLC
jgi:hypothetical protein